MSTISQVKPSSPATAGDYYRADPTLDAEEDQLYQEAVAKYEEMVKAAAWLQKREADYEEVLQRMIVSRGKRQQLVLESMEECHRQETRVTKAAQLNQELNDNDCIARRTLKRGKRQAVSDHCADGAKGPQASGSRKKMKNPGSLVKSLQSERCANMTAKHDSPRRRKSTRTTRKQGKA
ncbi:hypothetical protein HGRIS_005998 [Hohenbuehelia grisea]|uniref:Uncharacterized protein n=1 Tax=Hohenbuehelia grisea TaxID=104357 RepID=A0ABR3K003_9AGAR